MESKFGVFITIGYDGKIDYLFDIRSQKDLEDAIEYKNNKHMEEDAPLSDFEYIIEYLDNNEIPYDYLCLMGRNPYEPYDLEY